MALYQVTQGARINATDVNQFDQLLTGVMTDQPVTIANRISAKLTGATADSGYVGGSTSGPPTSGTFQTGDFVVDQSGMVWICTNGGSPGTWAGSGYSWRQEIVLSATTSSVTFSSIPSGFRDLELRIVAKNAGGSSGNLILQFNGDNSPSGTNYGWTVLYNQYNAAGPSINGAIGTWGLQVGKVSWMDFGGTHIIIYGYSDPIPRKHVSAYSGAGDGTLW